MNTNDRLMELVGRYADGIATADEVRELEAALRNDASLRRRFLQYMNIDAALAGATAAQNASDATLGLRTRSEAPRWRRAMAVATAAAILIAAVVLWRPWTKPGSPSMSSESNVVRPSSTVLLVAADHACWADPDVELPLRSGDMPEGLLRLQSGVVEFRFPGGATAVIQAPAIFRFPAVDQMFLQEGKARCLCPTPTSRITVTTPATQVIDLGTEFAVESVPASQATRVAVVAGKVRVGAGGGRVLKTGESVEVGPDRAVRLTPLRPETLAELLKADPVSARQGMGSNLLRDCVFSNASGASAWYRTQGHVDPAPGTTATVAVHARGHRFWPSLRQVVDTGDISDRLVVGSVDAVMPSDDPLCERQFAILKLSFIDSRGQEFATSFRYFLHAGSAPGSPASVQVAAFAPAGTVKVEIQLMLNARGQTSGSVWFSNPRLVVSAIADPGRSALPGTTSSGETRP